jgi:hypothetical protein
MAQHGYLGDNIGSEYDPGYDADDDRRERDHGRGSRDHERSWRGEDRGRWGDDDDRHRRGFMFDEHDRERSRSHDRDYGDSGRDRGFFSRSGDDSRSWFGDDSSGGRRFAGDQWRSGGESQRGQSGQRYSSHPDDHYRSWRDKQMQALDRDYADYCREREQQFHSDFDAWRSQRSGKQGPLRTGMTQTAQTGDMTGDLELTNKADPARDQPDPMADATLGTNTSEMSDTGKTRRS